MKKNNSKLKEFIQKRGFYIGLYSCAAIIVALAGVISLHNINSINDSTPNRIVAKATAPTTGSVDQDQLKTVDQNDMESYVEKQAALDAAKKADDQEKRNQDQSEGQPEQKTGTDVSAPSAIRKEPKSQPEQKETAPNSGTEQKNESGQKKPSTPNEQPKTEPKPDEQKNPVDVQKTGANGETKQPSSTTPDNPTRKSTVAGSSSHKDGEAAESSQVFEDSEAKDAIFSFFEDNQVMSWPVQGDIVMDYNVDTPIYDKTLEQYRTNNSICIAAPVGSQVKAASEGIVTKVDNTREEGNCVSIEHGNGWVTTYSQLQDNVLVTVGQLVKEGEVIGGVADPTLYSVLLGPHLDFKMTKGDAPEDPKLFLASN